MPHFGHVIVLRVEVKAEALTDVVIGVRTMSSRSGNGRRVTCVVAGVGADAHSVSGCGIDPEDPINMGYFLAT